METYLYQSPQLTVILACFRTVNSATLFLKMQAADCWWSMNGFSLVLRVLEEQTVILLLN